MQLIECLSLFNRKERFHLICLLLSELWAFNLFFRSV
ncbi:hypothetical protein DIKCMJMK_02051 [Shewanella oneidensis]|nr:hypothetical protein [Shewanella oneidensis]